MKNREEIKRKVESMSTEQLVDLFIKAEEADWYKEQLQMLNKSRYSSSSEKIINGQLNLFNEVEDIYDNTSDKEEEVVEVKTIKKKKKKETDYSNLPTRTIEHKLEDIHCEVCGEEMKELAPIITKVLKYQPARYVVEKYVIHQYICTHCTEEDTEAKIVSAPGAPKRLIKGSMVAPSVVAGIVFNKYVSGTPLYRQEQELKRKKIEISRAKMANWIMKCGEMLEPLYWQMQDDLQKQSHIHMDETTVVVLEDKKMENRQKSYMWVACSGKYEEKQMAMYFYHENREHDFAKEIIGADYAGGIHCDGYEAYHKFEYAKVLGCWSHCRRRFVEAMEVSPLHKETKKMNQKQIKQVCEENPAYGNIVEIIEIIRQLFDCEKKYIKEGYLPEEIMKERQREQKPILDEFFTRLEQMEQEYTRKSKMGVAIAYALNQRTYLEKYINDGKAEITNNRGERIVKPFVMTRKAWLFSNTKSGAQMSAIYCSLIESAKMNQLDVHNYLEYILEQVKEQGIKTNYQDLLPYSVAIPEDIKVS